jgi:Enoyl-CoA hydratase/isomerase
MMTSVSTPRWLSADLVDLTTLGSEPDHDLVMQLTRAAATREAILIGCCADDQVDPLRPLLELLTVTLVNARSDDHLPQTCVGCEQPMAAARTAVEVVDRARGAGLVLDGLLRAAESVPVSDGLIAESTAYSTLLAGDEFAAWRSAHPPRNDPGPTGPAALLSRADGELTITLNRPERHNAFSRWVRDAVCEGLDLALADSTINRVRLRGAGPSFCSGGDLDEFGSQPDVDVAHQIRLERSVAARLHQLKSRTVVELHGACIGAGMELAAFADQVCARPGTWFALPELSMGLIPGAGGTVSLPRRIGRWRTAWLALSGAQLDLSTALAWGMVDDVVEP